MMCIKHFNTDSYFIEILIAVLINKKQKYQFHFLKNSLTVNSVSTHFNQFQCNYSYEIQNKILILIETLKI